MALLMNRHNARMNGFVLRQLALEPTDRVLEIGFGGGVNLQSLIASAAFVAGVDRSREMVRRAQATFAGAIAAGRADFREGTLEQLPFEGASFEKVCTANTIYFLKSLDGAFKEMYRVLAPGGRLVIGFLPKERIDRLGHPADIFKSWAPEEVNAALSGAGFTNVCVERPEPTTPWSAVVATR
jgi:ubiquinone/menaquinone biosynthesis C-methylase UbiE